MLENTEVRHGRILGVDESTEAGDRVYVNGALDPTAKIRPGQLQRWRIFNTSADRMLVLRMAGGRPFTLMAEDGHTLERARSVRTLMIAPSSRRDVLVRGGPPGSYALKAIPFAQFPGGEKASNGGPVGNQTLLTLRSAGRPVHMAAPKGRLSHPVDLRGRPVDRERTIQFSEMVEPSGVSRFLLNGMSFDPNRTDVTMKLSSLERWTLVNTTREWHTFHMHINDFQVVSQNGVAVPFLDYQDNVALPPGSHTVVLVQASDFTGRFVFHCHVTFHEDRGMMATIEVAREPSASASRSSVVRQPGLAISSAAYGSKANRRLRACCCTSAELSGSPHHMAEAACRCPRARPGISDAEALSPGRAARGSSALVRPAARPPPPAAGDERTSSRSVSPCPAGSNGPGPRAAT